MLRVLAAALVLLLASASQAQESIETLPAPEGASSGEVIPETAAPPPPCGTQPITMARMQWPTAALLTEIHARILTANFGCDVRVQDGDMATVGSSMGANGQPAVAPEMWISRIAEIWNAAIKAQEVRQGGTSYAEQVFEGWFVPDYAVEAWPEITTIDGLKLRILDFGAGRRPKFITCPIDWGCNIINRNLLKANGLESMFEVVEPANRFELDTLIAEAVSRKEPILFYYWQPNAILAQFGFQQVDLGGYNKDNFLCMGRTACALPLPTGFAPDPVIVAVSEWVYIDAPQIAAYFQRAKMPFAEMNTMLQQLSETGATVETVAERFIADRGAVWKPWVGLPVDPAEGLPPGVEVPAASDPVLGAPSAEPGLEAPVEQAPSEPRRVEPEPEPEPEPEVDSPSIVELPPQSLT
jgi:glycine betaine/proline transport system substrate-binding protein